MIYVVIGQSGAGKTTWVKRRFLNDEFTIIESPVPHARVGNLAVLGRYGVGRRCEGTDTLPYNAVSSILQAVDRLHAQGLDICMEGDRINNKRVFEHIKSRGYPFELYLLRCPLSESMRRLRQAGSKITETFVKATRTKSARNFVTYGPYARKAQVIETCAES